ncbi:MAG: homoserine dehydrogenase [Clostridia bacterium]|nr:homoserine dehydrogenase [Clostridia bacterium]
MRIGLMGFGTVGSAFYAMARECKKTEIARLLVLEKLPGVDCEQTTDYADIVNDPAIDTVVELIGGLHPAHEYVTAALKAGKNVVTANKQLVCACYDELIALAEEHGVALRCTAAAGGGIPWLHSLARLSACDRITAVSGIMNGTTNYILSAMTDQGTEYADNLHEAQRLGYAEADPTADVEGYDARRKLVLSANIAFGVSIREEEVPCFGISGISAQDIAAFKRLGLVCKLIAHGELTESGVAACVEPMLFPVSGQMAHVNGPDNLISLRAERVGVQSFAGAGAGGFPTASNVLADCLEIAAGCAPFYVTERRPLSVGNDGLRQRYYVRTAEGADGRIMTVREAHALAAEYKNNQQPFFMAAVSEE